MAEGRAVRSVGPDPSGSVRAPSILHVDLDAFFASVEVLDDPSLAGLPVVVGGTGARGVVAACTYEARRFGVRSAMPTAIARRMCPDAVFLPGRYGRYVELSRRLHELFSRFTPVVEGIALDEAFLDVSGAHRILGEGPDIGWLIRGLVADELGLACSVGVARSKFVAKLASRAAKPVIGKLGVEDGAGVAVVWPDEELAFLHPLPVRSLWGVGPVTARRLEGIGVATVGDLAELPDGVLDRLLGAAQGTHLARLAVGDDPRPVVPDREAKSVGHEETFAEDIRESAVLVTHLSRMVDAATNQLRRDGLAARTVTVKVRFGDFSTITRSRTSRAPLDAGPAVMVVAEALLGSVDPRRGVRLLGVSLSGFAGAPDGEQLALDLGDRPATDEARD